MRTTLFAGLTQLDPLDPLSTDDYSFQASNPDIIDRLLEVGAVTHRHDGHAALSDPTTPPVASIVASGGSIPGGVTFEFAVTLVDADRGETAASPIGSVTTPDLIAAPTSAPVAAADYTGGNLTADTYYYATTWVDASGGETTLGAIRAVDVDPFPTAQVNLSGLIAGMPAGAVAWRLYRARGGEAFHFIWEDSVDTLTDDGSLCVNCQVFPPDVNTTTQNSTLAVSVGHPGASGAVSWRLYGRTGGSWSINSLLASGTDAQTLVFRTWGPTYGKPPVTSLSLPGASQIDPDTELLDWHWMRPIETFGALPSGTHGDVRLITGDGSIWGVLGASGAAGGDGWSQLTTSVAVTASASRDGHTFALMGEVGAFTPPDNNAIPGYFTAIPPGYDAKLLKMRHQIGSGASAGASAAIELYKNGLAMSGWTDVVTTTPTTKHASAIVADDDLIELRVNEVGGNPRNMSVTITEETTRP